jgi:CGNR zinc finger protein
VPIGAQAEHALLLRDFANTVDVDDGSDALADPAALTIWLRDHRLIPGRAAGVAAAGRHGCGDADSYGESVGTRGSGEAGEDAVQADLELAIALRGCLRAAMREHHQRAPAGGAPGPPGAPGVPDAPGLPGAPGAATATRATGAADGSTGAVTAGGGPGAASALEMAAARLPLRVAELAGRPALVPVQDGVRGGLAWLAAAIVASAADGSWERLKICADDTCQWAFLDSSKNRSKHWCSMQECGNRAKTRAYRARRGGGGSGE